MKNNLRPQLLSHYIGKEKAKQTLKIYIEAAKSRKNLWIMFFFMDLRGLEKLYWRELLQMR